MSKTIQEPVSWRKPIKDPVTGKVSKTTEVLKLLDITQFDSVDEAVSVLGAPRTLELVNSQHATNAKNETRAALRPGGTPTKTALKNEAMQRMSAEDWMDIATNGVGNPDYLNKKLDEKIALIKAERGIEDDDEG